MKKGSFWSEDINGSNIKKPLMTPSGFHPSALPAASSFKVTLFIKLSAGFVEVIVPSAILGVVTEKVSSLELVTANSAICPVHICFILSALLDYGIAGIHSAL